MSCNQIFRFSNNFLRKSSIVIKRIINNKNFYRLQLQYLNKKAKT